MMDDKDFDNFARCMGLKAILLLIQTQGAALTSDGSAPDPDFLANIPRMLVMLDGMAAHTGEGFGESDIERGVVRLMARMAMEYGKGRRAKK